MKLLHVIATCLAISSSAIFAEPPTTAPVEFSVQPAATPQPALKYRLLPTASERIPGNAAPLYMMGFLQLHSSADEQKQIADLLAAPRATFSIDAAKKILATHHGAMDEIALAARREYCRWEIPLREQGAGTLLPHLSPARDAARLLALRVRVHVAEKHFDDAVRTLSTGFSLVDHLRQDAVLVQGLVALAIENLLLERMEEMQRTPGSPNLYWAMASLPPTMVDLRAMTEMEGLFISGIFPEVKSRGAGEISEAEFQAMFTRVARLLEVEPEGGIQQKLKAAALVAINIGPARAWLAARGYTQKQAAEMPAAQAVGIYLMESFQRVSDDLNKWVMLPYWQGREGLKAVEQQLRQAMIGNNPLASLLPAMAKVYQRVTLTQRRFAMVQTVEALRAYAVDKWTLPKSVGELSLTPVPVDPMTGKPFEYETDGTAATLRGGDVPGVEQKDQSVWRFIVKTGGG